MSPIRRLLIANRGEIAVRIIRTAQEMGISTVVAVSEADAKSLAARLADAVAITGPAPATASYLNQDAVLSAALEHHCDAVHPGYGFLSENAGFARRVQDAGLVWVGPSPEAIELMGDKARAREAAQAAGVPVLPGSRGQLAHDGDSLAVARSIGFPLLIKAAGGGGGRGIRHVADEEQFLESLDLARGEAAVNFGNPEVYLERFVVRARHVEVQILGDGENVIHLGDRDCSLQRRSQKVVEEAPAPDIPDHVRARMRESSVELAHQCHYSGAGTVEFLYDSEREEASFIEMNTRLQVEHPVTEAITGIDLVRQQLQIAGGEPLTLAQDDIDFAGHAIECRINAEDPQRSFFPSPGTISRLDWPDHSVRVDAGVEQGDVIAPFYDSMIAKLTVHGTDRDDAIALMEKALRATRVEGVKTTIPVHLALLASPEFAAIRHDTRFIERTPTLTEATLKEDIHG
ncbi:acetyl-CoA carboxylase biotin carboxylase subunit [Sinomonas sp. ASV322]|uniref:acetyl-CoA carboxylase biotin carboxylase subunit n=1 Tax=Sinomonas sp. ASV322 TaxID=3041920 RepID=UPI0027DAEDA8|nr:acetyl-CoA carboxylase biotin carboxylase subunit [Sinomonas sp. ASV322]MDQ4504234.1 acetyl-CoA carboxylase biotin carboxylase subunit [Sinomonas sp. ASV322]